MALFVDQDNPYSSTLANSFYNEFAKNSQNTIIIKRYIRGQPSNLPQEANSAHEQDAQLQLIYFAGYSDDFDGLRITLHNMQNYSWAANVMMMGGDGLSNLGGYQNGYTHFLMTAFTFPDTWHVLGQSDPPFFSSYSADFGGNFPPPSSTPGPTPYGYIRPTSGSVLSYDAAEMLSNAAVALSKQTQNKLLTMSNLQQVLLSPNTNNTYQEISGQIRIGLSGDPINKAVLVLSVDPSGCTHLVAIYGDFLKDNASPDPQTFSTTDCS